VEGAPDGEGNDLGRSRQEPFWCLEAPAATSERKGVTRGVSGQAMSLASMVTSHRAGQHAPMGGDPSGVEAMVEATASAVAPATTLLEVGDAVGVKPEG
jgi:hypothetical protein